MEVFQKKVQHRKSFGQSPEQIPSLSSFFLSRFLLKEKSQRLQQWQCRTNGNTFRKPDFPLQLAATVLDLAYQCIKKQYSYCFQEYVLQVPESFLPFINVPCGPGELGFNYTTLYNRNFYYIFL